MWARCWALSQQELRPPADDLLAVLDVSAGSAPCRPSVRGWRLTSAMLMIAEGDLQRRVLVELVDDHVRVGVALQLDDQAAWRARGRTRRGRRRCRG